LAFPTHSYDPSSKFDHYAIEWVEVHQDGSVHAIISKRVQVCKWPGSTISTELISIGNPIGVSVKKNCFGLTLAQCGYCVPRENMCEYPMTPIRDNLATLQSYGGLQWELIKYINGISIGVNGFTGEVGPGQGFYKGNKFRILTISTANILANSSLESGNYDSVLNSLAQQAQRIKDMRDSGVLDLAAVIAEREANLPEAANGGSDDPCCNNNDGDFRNNCRCEPVFYASCAEACGPNCGEGNPYRFDANCNRVKGYGSVDACDPFACFSENYFFITGFIDPIKCKCAL
jgi:hypothetical protein